MNMQESKLSWSQETWDIVNQAVHEEVERARSARQFLPLYGPLDANLTEVPTDVFDVAAGTIVQGQTLPMVELFSEFLLTEQQVMKEEQLGGAKTASISRARDIAEAEDLLLYQGPGVALGAPFPPSVTIQYGQIQRGLLEVPPGEADLIVQVPQIAHRAAAGRVPRITYGENTYASVEQAIQNLYNRGHYGPYVLVLHPTLYADTKVPLPSTLIKPADQIEPLVTYYGSSRAMPLQRGIVASIGGNSMDLSVTSDMQVMFMQVNPQGFYSFKVMERLALRVKRQDAVVRLEFQ